MKQSICLLLLILLPKALLMPLTSSGKEQDRVLLRYKEAIQTYIMTGQEKGWKQCDILSDGFAHEGIPHISIELHRIETLDAKFAFASSHCLLVTYHIDSKASLKALLDFGWATIKHLRLALLIKMDSGINLNMATNVTKLPFLVAAESSDGRTQFLCPVIGETEPRLETHMCRPSYVSCKNKVLRVGVMGLRPHVVYTKHGIDGSDLRMLTMLSERKHFNSNIINATSFVASVVMVSIF